MITGQVSFLSRIRFLQGTFRNFWQSIRTLQTLLSLTIFLLVPVSLMSQSDSLSMEALLSSGDQHYRDRVFDSARLYYLEGMDIAKQLHLREKQARIHLHLGNTYVRAQKPRKAIAILEKGLELWEDFPKEEAYEIYKPYKTLAAAHGMLGHAAEARRYRAEAHRMLVDHFGPDHLQTAKSFYNLAIGAMNSGRHYQALDYYQKVLPVFLRAYPEGHQDISGLYVNMAIAYSHLKDSDHAIDYILKANEMDVALGGEDHWVLAYNYLNLGQLYRGTGRDSLAEFYISRSQHIAHKNQIHLVYATTIFELGQLAEKQGDLVGAQALYQEAIESIQHTLGAQHPHAAYYLRALGDSFSSLADFDLAEQSYDRAITLLENVYGRKHPRLATAHLSKAELFTVMGDHQSAHSELDLGFQAIQYEDSVSRDPMLVNASQMVNLVCQRGTIYRHQFDLTCDLSFLREALHQYHIAEKLMDRMRRGFISDDSKVFFQEQSVKTYSEAVQLCLALYEETDSIEYFHNAFAFSEKNKSVLLSEALAASANLEIRGMPPDLVTNERDLQALIEHHENDLLDQPEDSTLQSNLDRCRRQYDSLVQIIRHEYPDYFDLKYNTGVVSVIDLQQKLHRDEGFLSYFQGDSMWTIFYIDPHKVHYQGAERRVVDPLIEQFREMIMDQTKEYEEKIAHQLYELLIPQHLDPEVLKLTIVPDGALTHIPFEALLIPSKDQNEFLVERFSVSRVNSASLYCRPNVTTTASLPYVGFAPEYTSDGETRKDLPPLPLSVDEVQVGFDHFGGQQFVQEQATEHRFKSLAASPSILHLAMHTLIDDQVPAYSRLIFSHNIDTIEDGLLHSHEIYNLHLPSELAILSACNTGYGPINRGEGVFSLSRAFSYAGCPNILMSLWPARDHPTFSIISGFLENLHQGMGKSSALRESKLSYLAQADPLQSHPANWATLVLLGDHNPVQIRQTFPWMIASLVGFALLLLWFGYRTLARVERLHSGS